MLEIATILSFRYALVPAWNEWLYGTDVFLFRPLFLFWRFIQFLPEIAGALGVCFVVSLRTPAPLRPYVLPIAVRLGYIVVIIIVCGTLMPLLLLNDLN